MAVLQAVLLGIAQGITEFLPVSSSGHLAILRNMFHVRMDDSAFLCVMLRLGALIAVLAVYRRDIGRLLLEAVRMAGDLLVNLGRWMLRQIHKKAFPYRKLIRNSYRKWLVLFLISAAPAGAIRYLLRNLAEDAGDMLLIPGICFLIMAVLLMMADTVPAGHKRPRGMEYTDGLKIGIAGGISVLPGLSCSGTALAACLLCGVDDRFAVKYSFLVFIPAVLEDILLELPGVAPESVTAWQAWSGAAGLFCAAAAGYVCIKLMFLVVRNRKYRLFAVYCTLAGAAAVGGHFFL